MEGRWRRPRLRSPSSPGSTRPYSRFRSPSPRRAFPAPPRWVPMCCKRTGIATTLAYLRMGISPDADPKRGHRPDDPTTLSRDRAQCDQNARRNAPMTSVSGHQSAWPVVCPDGTSPSFGLRRLDRSRGRTPAATSTRGGRPGRADRRSAWGRRWMSWTRPGERRTGRPTPTISWRSSRWRRSIPTSPPSNPGFGLPSEGDLPKDRRYTSRRSTRSKAESGNTSLSTVPLRASSRTG